MYMQREAPVGEAQLRRLLLIGITPPTDASSAKHE